MKPEALRWFQQRWILDSALRAMGPAHFTAGALRRSYEAIGSDVMAEADRIAESVKNFEDIKREVLRAAGKHESAAEEAEKAGHRNTAKENYFIASLLYGASRWSIWEDNEEIVELTDRMVSLFGKFAEYSETHVERVSIPFEGKSLYGILWLPHRTSAVVPCVVSVPGMDTFKEQTVRMYGDKLLERGIAVLALDGPGQGETRVKGLTVTPDNFDRAGTTVMDYLRTRKEIDSTRIALRGASFGSYWCPRILAHDNRYKAGVAALVCHEPGMRTLFESASPTFKVRHMWMTGISDEKEFDEKYASRISLGGIGSRIECPFLIVAGEDDELSPIEHTYRFYSEIHGPKKLVVYQGEHHSLSHHPEFANIAADFISDAMAGNAIRSEKLYVTTSGQILKQ